VRVIVLAEKRHPHMVVAAFSSGAKGFFCLENSRLNDLGKCIERVHNGQIWANSEELSLVMGVFERFSMSALPLGVVNALGTRLLSPREEDVVKLLMEGMQNREIARTLNLSGHTIKNYLFNIYEKLGISSRTELLLYVLTPRKSFVPSLERDGAVELANGTNGTA
jgi:DNA-binding NarL/FixJ family response regulator